MNGIRKIMAPATRLILLAGVMTVALAGMAFGQIDLRFTPQDTLVTTDTDAMRVSVMLDDAVWFRTIELTVAYDTTVIRSVGAGQGELFSSSGFNIWEGYEESTPGYWHGFAIIIGAQDSLSGPGELFYWDIDAIAEGSTPITVVEAKIYTPTALPLAGVNLPDGLVDVTLGVNAVADLPLLAPALELHPNPFNPRTRIFFDLPQASPAALSVFDTRGRLVVRLFDGLAPAGPWSVTWDGRDDRGTNQPGGVYLFRLEVPGLEPSLTKGVLLK